MRKKLLSLPAIDYSEDWIDYIIISEFVQPRTRKLENAGKSFYNFYEEEKFDFSQLEENLHNEIQEKIEFEKEKNPFQNKEKKKIKIAEELSDYYAILGFHLSFFNSSFFIF